MGEAVMKKCGFVVRVSTDRQAANEEGSLKNQLQRLRAHVKYKKTACNEDWVEADTYVLRAVSGKDSLRSEEMGRLFEGIRSGRINTVACTALDRICRSVKDFLSFFEILNEYGVEFVSLKQNYDTTTPQGKLFTTIMMALAEFEREQTSDRNKEATLARAERGLWNGGQLIGYDLDPDRKGNLIPNEKEIVIVNFAADTYLECGSILETMRTVNARGYRTKEYTSRRDKAHPAREFSYTGIQGTMWPSESTTATSSTTGFSGVGNAAPRWRACAGLDERARSTTITCVKTRIADSRCRLTKSKGSSSSGSAISPRMRRRWRPS
jgi:site-specific DNA recombinase